MTQNIREMITTSQSMIDRSVVVERNRDKISLLILEGTDKAHKKGVIDCCQIYSDMRLITRFYSDAHSAIKGVVMALKSGAEKKSLTMLLTHSPCEHCSTLILESNLFHTVIYSEEIYFSGINFLREEGVFVQCIKNSELIQ